MRKSKIFAMVMIMLMMLSACGNAGGTAAGTKSTAYQKGLEVVALLEKMVWNDTYVQLYTASAEIQEIVETVAKGDYTEPSAVYEISLSGESLSALAETMCSNVSMEGMLHFCFARI